MKSHKPGELFEKHRAKMEKKHKDGLRPASVVVRNEQNASHQMYKKHEKKHEKKQEKHEKTHKKNWIAGAIKKPGALHRSLGVKQGEKIPASKLTSAAKKGGVTGKRARLAQTLKSFHKGHAMEHEKMHKHHMKMHAHHMKMAEHYSNNPVMHKHHKMEAEHHHKSAMHHKHMMKCA